MHQRYGVEQCGSLIGEGEPALGPSTTLAVLPVLAAFGVCETSGFVAAVVALDGALQGGLATVSQVGEWAVALRRRTGMSTIRAAIAAADPWPESPLETQTRVVLTALGYRPRSQVTLHTPHGEFVARVDPLIEELGVVIEADGRVKYGQTNSTEILVSEKRRESAIVDLGYAVVRLEHPDVMDPPRVDTRIKAAARRVQPHRRRHGRLMPPKACSIRSGASEGNHTIRRSARNHAI